MNKITHLIPSIEFGKSISNVNTTDSEYRKQRNRYDKLLQQSPKLSDFVPCINGVPVSEPKIMDAGVAPSIEFQLSLSQYQQAKSNCLFEGWRLTEDNNYYWLINNGKITIQFNKSGDIYLHTDDVHYGSIHTLEDLAKYNLPITDNARQILYQ